MKLNVPSTEEQYAKGLQLFQSGNIEGAFFYFQNVLIADPNHAHARNDLGALYYEKGEHEQAFVHLKRACELMPNDKTANSNLRAVRQKLELEPAAP